MLVVKSCKDSKVMLGFSDEMYNAYNLLAEQCEVFELMENMKVFSGIEAELKYALSPKTLIETAIISCISESEKKN